LARRAQIIPTAIIGGEECFPAAATLRFVKPLIGTAAPLPLTLLPLPSRWKFIFHDPIRVDDAEPILWDRDPETQKHAYRAFAARVQSIVQETLDRETSHHLLVRLGRRLARGRG
jgi:hypothetical protein